MKKQSTAAIAIILITCLLGYGLTAMLDMTALERLKLITSAQVDVDSYHIEGDGKIKMNVLSDEEIPAYMESVMGIYENVSFKVSGDFINNMDHPQMKLVENIDMNGIQANIEIYWNKDKVLLKYPIIGDYILITMDDVKQLTDIELPENFYADLIEILSEMSDELNTIYMSYLNDENVKYGQPYIMNTNGYEQTLNVIEVSIDSEMIIQIYADMLLTLLNNDKAMDLLESTLAINDESLPENFMEDLDEAKSKIIEVKDPTSDARADLYSAFGDFLPELNYTVKLGVTNINIPKMAWANMDVILPVDDMEDVNMHMQYDLVYRLSEFNSIDAIEMPELEDSDIIKLSDLIEKFGGL